MVDKNQFLELLGLTPEEALGKVADWTSNLSDDEHKVKSVILEIHSILESRLKIILSTFMRPLISKSGTDQEIENSFKDFNRTIEKMSFTDIFRLLKPCIESYDKDCVAIINLINILRNQCAHRDISDVLYKERSPFSDRQCLAQVFAESWSVGRTLDKFLERMVEDPQQQFMQYAKYYRENYSK